MKLSNIEHERANARAALANLETHLYPPPVWLDVAILPVIGGELLVVHVPPQPDEVKPFLVHGAIVDGKGEGSFISIVRRHGEDTIPITAPAVQRRCR